MKNNTIYQRVVIGVYLLIFVIISLKIPFIYVEETDLDGNPIKTRYFTSPFWSNPSSDVNWEKLLLIFSIHTIFFSLLYILVSLGSIKK